MQKEFSASLFISLLFFFFFFLFLANNQTDSTGPSCVVKSLDKQTENQSLFSHWTLLIQKANVCWSQLNNWTKTAVIPQQFIDVWLLGQLRPTLTWRYCWPPVKGETPNRYLEPCDFFLNAWKENKVSQKVSSELCVCWRLWTGCFICKVPGKIHNWTRF